MSHEDQNSIINGILIHVLLCGFSFLQALSFVTVFSAVYATKTIEMRMKELAVNLLFGSFYFGIIAAAFGEILYNQIYLLMRFFYVVIQSAFS